MGVDVCDCVDEYVFGCVSAGVIVILIRAENKVSAYCTLCFRA